MSGLSLIRALIPAGVCGSIPGYLSLYLSPAYTGYLCEHVGKPHCSLPEVGVSGGGGGDAIEGMCVGGVCAIKTN